MQSELTLSLLLGTKPFPSQFSSPETSGVFSDRCAPQPFSLEQGDSHLPSMGLEVTQLENMRGLFPSSPAAD